MTSSETDVSARYRRNPFEVGTVMSGGHIKQNCSHARTIAVSNMGDGVLVRCLECGRGRIGDGWTEASNWDQISATLASAVYKPEKYPPPPIGESTRKVPLSYGKVPSDERITERWSFVTGFACGAGTVTLCFALAMWLMMLER